MKLINTTFLLAMLVFSLAGCRTPVTTDKEIGTEIQREIDRLNRIVITALREQKTKEIIRLGSTEFLKTDSIRTRVRRMAKGAQGLKLATFSVEHQVFSDKLQADSVRIAFREGTEQEYSLVFYQPGLPTVASFLTIPEDRRELSLVTVFSKGADGWKLNSLQIGIYRIEGLAASDWYFKARQQDDAGAQVDALISQTMAQQTLTPGGEHIRYKMSTVIAQQTLAVATRAKGSFGFPIVIDEKDENSPRVIGVQMDCDSLSCIPLFIVETDTKLEDTAGLNRDCRSLTANMDQLFNGVSNRNKTIAVQLVNEDYFDKNDPSQFRLMRVPTVAAWRY